MKEYVNLVIITYLKAIRALREGRNTNPAHKDVFNLLRSYSYMI